MGQNRPFEQIRLTSPPKSGICSHWRCSISTRGDQEQGHFCPDSPASQQDKQSGQPPTCRKSACQRAHVKEQRMFCTPAVFSHQLWHISIGGESHLLCMSLGGTGKNKYFSEQSQRDPSWKTGYFGYYNPVPVERGDWPQRLREMLKSIEESSSRACSIIQTSGTTNQDQDPCLKTIHQPQG